MVSLTAVIIIGIIVIVFIAHKLLQETLDFVQLAISVVGMLLAVGLVVVVWDALSFRHSLKNSESLIALAEEGKVVHVVELKGENVEELSPSEIEKVSESVDKNDLGSALGSHYKLILIDSKVIQNSTSSKEAALAAFAKNMLSSPTFLISQIRSGNIRVYPESYVFSAIRMTKLDIVSKVKNVF